MRNGSIYNSTRRRGDRRAAVGLVVASASQHSLITWRPRDPSLIMHREHADKVPFSIDSSASEPIP